MISVLCVRSSSPLLRLVEWSERNRLQYNTWYKECQYFVVERCIEIIYKPRMVSYNLTQAKMDEEAVRSSEEVTTFRNLKCI